MFHFKKLTLVLQDGRAECGHACIVMLAQYWGHDINLNFVRTVYANSDRGMHLGEMKQVFQRLGCHARALRIDPAQIKKISAPLILHWNENHFVVLKKVHRASVTIYDPALGKYRCSWKNFVESFSGVVLEVERASSFQPIREKKELRLLDCLYPIKDIKQWLILSICLACTVESFALLQPLFLQYVTDEVLGAGATNNIKCLAAVFLLCVCAQLFFDWVKGNLSVHVSNMILKQFSRDVMQHLLRLPLSYFEQRFLGDIQAKFRSLEDIQKKIGQDLVRVWLDGIFVLCCTLIMFRYSLFLTAVVWINLMVYLLIRGGAYYYLRSKTDMSWHQHALAASSFLETVRTIISIKCFMKEQVRLNTWYERYLRGVQADAHIAKHHITYQVLSQGILQVDHLLILCIGASMIMNQRFSLGMLMAFLSY
ncbi:MAG: cysteine peptidase family C39 domain-containing protein, partial [Legionellaceae bacterium]|nr:cysteine peptidase family C39 domain-containing protein [Legionellaceae bacterium]